MAMLRFFLNFDVSSAMAILLLYKRTLNAYTSYRFVNTKLCTIDSDVK